MVEKKITLAGFHPLRFFSKLGTTEKNAAFFTSGEWNILAWNPAKTITGTDALVFEELKKLPIKKSDVPFAGGAVGYCSYELGCMLQGVRSRHKSRLPLAVFHVYDSALLWNGKDTFIIGDDRFRREVETLHARPFIDACIPPIVWTSSVSKSVYRKKFIAAMNGIRNGDFYQLNVSYPFTAQSDVESRRLFSAYTEHHPALCASYFEHQGTAIISLSPERFVTIRDGVIHTSPIKGTRPRGVTPAKDIRQAQELLSSTKEEAELNMITDLLRNDVGKVSETGTVKVLEHRALQKNPSVWHTYSVVCGTLGKNLHPVDAFASMFPGGSVTGCPKVAAMKEIDQLEDQSRGAYCGSMLMVSTSGFLDSTILIRTIVQQKKSLTLGMGGGIVADSDCFSEFDETRKKAQSFLTFSQLFSPRYFRGPREISSDAVAELFDPANPKIRGVFETMRADGGKIHDVRAHLKRLRSSAALLNITIPPVSRLAAALRSAVKKSAACSLRVKIICTTKDTLIETRVLTDDPARKNGIAVTILPLDRALTEAKSLPYHREYYAHTKALEKGFHEALLVRSDGSIGEGAYSNVFFVKDETLWTADTDILFGITRQTVIRCAKRQKIPVRYVSLQETDLWHAEEIFITSSLHGITPVVRLCTEPVGDGTPGKITRALQKSCATQRSR